MLAAFLVTLVAILAAEPNLCHAKDSKPLLLTPILEKGQINRAKFLSKVQTNNIPLSYSGFITVNKDLSNHLFFWFFPNQKKSPVPLLLWLNGGPGYSSMVNLLEDHGPIEAVDKEHRPNLAYFKLRNNSLVEEFSVLYVDQPVGVGYSFSDKGQEGYRVTQEGYTDDMFSFLVQFFKMFPEFKTREFYLGGQSYAGRYIPALAHRIHLKRKKGFKDIPLTGIYLGAPYFDPEEMAQPFFDYLYYLGAISYADNVRYKRNVSDLIKRFQNGHFEKETMDTVAPVLVPNLNLDSLENYVTGESADFKNVANFMNNARIRYLLHVGSKTVYNAENQELFKLFGQDVLRGTKSELAELMDNYKVLIFSGNYDIIVSNLMIESALLTMPWSGQAKYNRTTRTVWRKDSSSKMKGFYSKTDKFCRVVVHGAGHNVAHDQPEIFLSMMKQFVKYGGCIQW